MRPLVSTTSMMLALETEGERLSGCPVNGSEGGAIATGTKPDLKVWFLDLNALIQRRRRLGVIPCRRATADTFAPGPVASPTICCFSARLRIRRVKTTAKLCAGSCPDIATDLFPPRTTVSQKSIFRRSSQGGLHRMDTIDLPSTRFRLAIGDDPDIGRDAGIVEHVGGQPYDGLKEVILQHVAAD